MKLKTLAIAALSAATLASCSGNKQDNRYTLNADLGSSYDGQQALLVDFDTNEHLDSVIIADGKVTFEGTIDEPTIVRLYVDGQRVSDIILEPGITEFKDGKAINGLEEKYQAIYDDLSARRDSFGAMITEEMSQEEQMAIYNLYLLHVDSIKAKAIAENAYNPIGYLLALQQAAEMELDEFEQLVAKYPHFGHKVRFTNIKNRMEAKAATQPGNPYVDFSFEQDGETVSLSQYINKDGYTLVDFWASWCGPCKREIEVIKQLYAKYRDKGLTVVGVDVWEEPEAARNYLAEHPLEWNVLFTGSGNNITDLYGINGIPCILLINPEGTIIARDLQDDDLVNAVSTAIEG